MAKKVLFLILLDIAIVIAACQESPSLNVVGLTNIEFSADGGNTEVTFSANRDWTISWSDAWLSVFPSMGKASDGPITVTVHSNPNTTDEARTAEVTIKMAEFTQSITVRQSASQDELVITGEAFDVMAYSVTLIGYANLPFEIGDAEVGIIYDKKQSFEDGNKIVATGLDSNNMFTVTVPGLKPNTTYYYKAYVQNGMATKYGAVKSFTTKEVGGGVDLGLPSGLKWATCNLGADTPEEYGDYFAWGETEPYYTAGHSQDNPCRDWKDGKAAGYNWESYQWCNGSSNQLAKYNYDSSYGIVDNMTTFSDYGYADDAARQVLGGSWRTPTDADWTELRNNCTWIWTDQKGVNGYLVSGSNGNTIFLPASGSGSWDYFGHYGIGSHGSYWSSSLSAVEPFQAYGVRTAYTNSVERSWANRCCGLSIRPVSGMSVDKISMNMSVGKTLSIASTVLPSYATGKTVIWSSSDKAVAEVNEEGFVTAVGEGTATITATAYYDGVKTAVCIITVTTSTTGSDWVDLGLPSGLKWATCNLGANVPEEYGDYFAWGETEPYYDSLDPLVWKSGKENGYDWASYKWRSGSSGYLRDSKYDDKKKTEFSDYEYEDDAARQILGGTWRTPTYYDWDELIDNCTWTWQTLNGVKGYLVTGRNGKTIFFPAAGLWSNVYIGAALFGRYMSSSLNADDMYRNRNVSFSADSYYRDNNTLRWSGYSVRPVLE